MSKPPMNKKNSLRYILLIPIIAFIIGYFIMGIIQALDLDVKLLDFESKRRLDFNAAKVTKSKTLPVSSETSPEERTVQSTTSKVVQLPEITVHSIQIGSFSTDQQALSAYTAALKRGYGGTIYKDRAMRVLIAAAPTREMAELLVNVYEDEFESISVEIVTFKPKILILGETEESSQLVKAAEILTKLLVEAHTYMTYETITPHSTKEKKAFLKSQTESIMMGRQTLEQTYLSGSLSSVRNHILQLFKDHESNLLAWSVKRNYMQSDLWQGLLSELLLYEQIVR